MSAPAKPAGDAAQAHPTAARLAALIVRLRWLWVVMALAIGAGAVMGLKNLTFDPDARSFFAEENPDRQALDAFEAAFAKDDNLMMVIAPKDGAVFTPDTLAMIGDLTERAWLLPYVRRVDSLTNFQHTYAEGDEMIVRDLAPDPANMSEADAEEARGIALSRVELVPSMVSPEADVTQVQVMFRLPGEDKATEVPTIVAEAEALQAEFVENHPEIDLRLTGSVMINNQFAVSGQQDGQTLTPLMFLAVLLVVFLALRSVLAVVSVVIVIALSALSGLGALGWSGVPLNSVTVLAPLYIMTLAVASAVHVLASVRNQMPDFEDRKDWARNALTNHMGAITVACVTTAIGFLSLNFSISPPFRELGNVVAVGVMAALALTLTLLPALVVILPFKRREARPALARFMEPLAEFVIRWRKAILVVSLAVVAGLGAGVTRIALEDDFIRYFDERYEFRRDADFTEARLTGLNALEYPIRAGEENGINNPEYLLAVEGFSAWLREQPGVTAVRTLTDTVKRLNMNMHADDPAYYRLPDSAEEAAQYLFLYELSLGYGMDLTDQINIDRSAMRVTVQMANVTTTQMRELTSRAETWFAENAPQFATRPTGVTQVFNLISYRDVRAMLSGTALALVLISGVIMLTLWSLRIGLVSLIPNLVPALMAFGVWGYLVGQVTLAISVVVAATLGIVVDDTVHFLSKYREGRKQGLSAEDSVRHSFRKVGMALLITTIGLVAGFTVLAQSGFAVNGDMAKLTAITISIALIADFTLLPALLIAIDKGKETMSIKSASAPVAAALALVAGLGFIATDAKAQSAEEKGLAIAKAAEASDTGWGDYRSTGEMILRDAGGGESRRAYWGMNLERDGSVEGDWSVIVFTSPRDIKGTATLTHSKLEPNDDDQWLFLPAVKRVKRISSSNRTGKFVGSEFSYEDLGSQDVADYTYKWLRDEACPGVPGQTCHVVESYPKNSKSGYSKRISWADTQEYRQHKVEFYNRRGDLEKVLTASGFQAYAGDYWRPSSMVMQNRQTGKSTELTFPSYQFRAGLGEGDFNAQRLPRLAR